MLFSTIINLVLCIATVCSSVVAVIVALSTTRERLEVAIIWKLANKTCPRLIVSNIGNKTAVLKNITFIFRGEEIVNIDLLSDNDGSEDAMLPPGKIAEILIKPEDIKYDHLDLDDKVKYESDIIVQTIKGREYKTKFKLSRSDINGLQILAGWEE